MLMRDNTKEDTMQDIANRTRMSIRLLQKMQQLGLMQSVTVEAARAAQKRYQVQRIAPEIQRRHECPTCHHWHDDTCPTCDANA
jgi:hypothetical protein